MFSTLVLSLALLSPAAAPNEPKPATKSYSLDTSGTSAELKAGQGGTFKLQIKPEKGYHVSPDAPLKILLSGEGLAFKKETLGHDDAADKKAEAPLFATGFDAKEAGKRAIAADATFFVCSETLCERKNEKLTVWVQVKP